MLKDLVLKNRTYRRFYGDFKVDCSTLKELVDLARLSSSAGNKQPLRYVLSCDKGRNDLIFPNLSWAASLKDWDGPEIGERPSAYIFMLADKEAQPNYYNWDAGIAASAIMLGATERGLGGCIIASVNRSDLATTLNIPDKYVIVFVLAIGKPKETVVLEPVAEGGSITYYRDENQVHHVPKRALEDIILDI
ncbi:MAG: nitroreductase family protein [Caldisericaceae bacterium]